MAELDLDGTPLCVLTVHAHPDDEASKGAPTLARYHAEGVRTVLVCCTGGEEGELQNPSLREPGQPFHGLEPEQEKALLSDLRPQELARSLVGGPPEGTLEDDLFAGVRERVSS